MADRRILLCLVHIGTKELEYIHKAFDDNWVVPLGPDVNAFEHDLAQYIGTQADGSVRRLQCVALSCGTAAVHLALAACGVAAGDEVLVQSFTFCASANPIKYLGATPVFIDSEPHSWNMDPELLRSAILDRINTTGRPPKAIIVVHLYGMPAQIDRILQVANEFQIPVIEDAAEALGSEFDGHRCGSFGHFGVLSFNGNKMITTSGGGALICPDDEARSRAMFFATQAREAYPYYHHTELGYNYRMSNICACIGRGQMEILPDHIAHHRRVQDQYRQLLADIPGITLHENPSPKHNANFWLCTITLSPDLKVVDQDKAYAATITKTVGGAAGTTRAASNPHTDCEPNTNVEALRLALEKAGIESRPLWKPMHRQPLYADAPAYINGVSDDLFRRGLCLPAGPWVSDDDLQYISQHIHNAIIK